MDYHIREATNDDIPTILHLLPRLANFELPERRVAAHLWEGDAELLKRWGGWSRTQLLCPDCSESI